MKAPFYVIGIRHNPQLGSYLSKAIVAEGTWNKTSITARFEEYGSKTSLKFELSCSPANRRHYAKSSSSCAYGSYSYYGYHEKLDAINELKTWIDKPGSSSERAKNAIAQLEAA